MDVLRALINGGADLNKALPVTTYFSVYVGLMSSDIKFSPDSFRARKSRKSGKTPLAFAKRRGHAEAAALIEAAVFHLPMTYLGITPMIFNCDFLQLVSVSPFLPHRVAAKKKEEGR